MVIRNHNQTEVVSEVVFLGKLLERIASGRVRVPHFQRAFVWSQMDVLDLLDSVFEGFPIGAILLWETDPKNITSSSHVGPIKVDSSPSSYVEYLLDGQQRVSTLFGTLMLTEKNPDKFEHIDWRVYFDLEKSKFTRAPRGQLTPRYFPIAGLLTTSGFYSAAQEIYNINDSQKSEDWLEAADRLSNAFKNYQIPLIRIRTSDINSAVKIFSKLNRKGRKITIDEMVSALTFRQGKFHLSAKLDQLMGDLTRKGFGNLNRVFLIRAVLAALGHDIYAKDWVKIMVDDEIQDQLPEKFELAITGINHALTYLRTLGVTSDKLLPYGLQLVFLGEFYRHCPNPKPNTLCLIKRWFWVTSFTGWFGTANTSMVTHSLNEMIEIASGKRENFNTINLDMKALPFPNRFDGRSARARAFLLYLSSLEPLSLIGNGRLEPGILLSSYGLNSLGYISYNPKCGDEFRSVPANRMFMDSELNGDAIEHLNNLEYSSLLEILPSHGFSMQSIETLKMGDIRKLINDRQKNLIHGEKLFMKKLQVQLPEMATSESIADSDTSNYVE